MAETPTPVESHDADPMPEFVNLLTRHQSDIWAFLLALMPGHPDVADVQQKVNLVLWKKRGDFTPGSDFRAWALTVARYEVMAHRKHLGRQPYFIFDAEVIEQLADDAPAELWEAPERLQALERCLAHLRDEDRKLLRHRYWKRGSLEDYARGCGRSVSALSVSLFRLRAALRRCIANELETRGTLS